MMGLGMNRLGFTDKGHHRGWFMVSPTHSESQRVIWCWSAVCSDICTSRIVNLDACKPIQLARHCPISPLDPGFLLLEALQGRFPRLFVAQVVASWPVQLHQAKWLVP